MKKLITLLSAISIALISCQQNLSPDTPEISAPADEVMTKSLSTGKVTPDDPFIFSAAKDMKSFTDIGPLEDRFAACEVPVSRLDAMTTEALVKSMLNYPLNYLVLFYNDPQEAIDLIVEYSPLHQEFLSRSDAAEVFVDFYAAADLDISPEKGNLDGNYTSLSYTNTMFMDHFIGSGLMTGLGKASVKQKLAEAVEVKLQERIKAPGTFSMHSINPLLAVNEAESLGLSTIGNRSNAFSYRQDEPIPRGRELDFVIFTESSVFELNQLDQAATTNYPNAVLLDNSTHRYNSHSYAWHNSSTDNTLWLDRVDSDGAEQLSKYWSTTISGSCCFETCSNESSASIVYYLDGDHSATRVSYNTYVSKWSDGPLMQHAPSYCPYIVTNMQYYIPRLISGTRPISGNTTVALNQANNYTISGTGEEGLDYRLTVLFMDAPSPTPFELYQISSNTYSLVCQDYGYFTMKWEGYYNTNCLERNRYAITCLP